MEGESILTAQADGIVRRAREGDVNAFVELCRANAGHVYAVCLRMLANPGLATELAQETMVKAWQMIGSFRDEAPFTAWIRQIAVNAVLDYLRSEKRRHARVIFTDEPEGFETGANDSSHESAIDIENAVAKLPVQARTVLVLHDIEGYSHAEIGAMLGITIGTSKAHLHRARIQLRKVLR
jgi:RNA polymerase sigma-70 factor, ECF subfamily